MLRIQSLVFAQRLELCERTKVEKLELWNILPITNFNRPIVQLLICRKMIKSRFDD